MHESVQHHKDAIILQRVWRRLRSMVGVCRWTRLVTWSHLSAVCDARMHYITLPLRLTFRRLSRYTMYAVKAEKTSSED